jgi:hypothetical protein
MYQDIKAVDLQILTVACILRCSQEPFILMLRRGGGGYFIYSYNHVEEAGEIFYLYLSVDGRLSRRGFLLNTSVPWMLRDGEVTQRELRNREAC